MFQIKCKKIVWNYSFDASLLRLMNNNSKCMTHKIVTTFIEIQHWKLASNVSQVKQHLKHLQSKKEKDILNIATDE
jgi:hypothetical protein